MSSPSRFLAPKRSLLALMLLHVMTVQAQDAPAGDDPTTPSAAAGDSTVSTTLSQVEVVGQATTYAKAVVTKEMLDRQSVMTSVNGVLNELPGVLVTEADTYGSSDWGTQISMRGFVSNRDTQQIGTTIDGLPNGGSGYGGGSRANRYLDILNLQTVEVSQGTADIASRSNEALGGTLNYVTDDPLDEQRLRFVVGAGEHQARKYYVRYDSGQWLGNTRAWVSASSAENRDWIDGSGKTTRDHMAGKFVSELGRWTVSGYLSWDEANESEYSSVSLAQYAIDPEHDSLTGTWTGIPYLDQQFRSGSRALRENTFGYLRGRFDGDRFKASVAAYGHRMEGRGDWIPPYLADVNADGAGNPESEFTGGTTNYGGPNLGRFYFVTPGGAAATMIAGCTGTGGVPPEYDPSCYPAGSLAVQSYRHSHYDNRRVGVTADLEWRQDFGAVDNSLRGGLWLERGRRSVTRDWHRLLDTRIGMNYDHRPYWVQFKDAYELDEVMYYVEDVARIGAFAARIGVKQFFVDQRRDERINGQQHARSDSESDPLFSAGLTWTTPVEGMEVFAGFSENFAAIPSGVLGETDPVVLSRVKPETADNIELGLRVSRWPLTASATLYDIRFDNRIVYVPASFVDGIDYLGETDGVYENYGGVQSRGLETALGYGWDNGWRLSGAYTYNKSTYLGSGDAERDEALEIVEGAQVFGIPKHTLVLSADWQGEAWNFGLSGRYLGERYLDASNSEKIDAVTLFNAHVGVDLVDISPRLKGMAVDLTVNNLTDKRYLSGVDGGGSAFIGAPRAVSVALTVDF